MDKIKKIALIIFICFLNVFLISLSQNFPISISLTNASLFKIPLFFWIFIGVTPFLLYIIAKSNKNKFIKILCAMFYYFIFYSYGLYFISHPTISDIGSSTVFQELLKSITHIGAFEISIESYFQWPVYFIFSKIFSSTLGTGSILTLNLAFIILISIFPVFLILFYQNRIQFTSKSNFFIVTALFLTLSFFFINDQFVPQFLALMYLFILYGCYIKFQESKSLLFLGFIIIFYTLCVFTHAFMYLFFLLSIFVELIWSKYLDFKESNSISYELILLLIIIPFIYITVYLQRIRNVTFGQSNRIFESIASQRGSNDFYTQHLYTLVPKIYDLIFSNLTKIIVATAFIIVAIGLFLYLYKNKKGNIIDLGIIAGTLMWFILGLSRMVLGQRALQVAPLALSTHYKNSHKKFLILTKIIIVLILISPSLFVANNLINESLSGERFIQDKQENIAGKFLDNHLYNSTFLVIGAQNAYPTGINFQNVGIPNSIDITNYNEFRQYIDFIVD